MVRIHLPCGEFFIANSGVKVTRIHPFSGVFFTTFQASGKGLFLAASGEISQQPVPHIATILRRYNSQSAHKKEAGFFIRPLATGIYLINRKFRLVSVLFVKSFHDFPGSFRNVGARSEDGHSSVFLQEVIVPDGNNAATDDQ